MRPHASIETLAFLLRMCRFAERSPSSSLRLHSYIHEHGLDSHTSVGNDLVELLADALHMSRAQHVFDKLAPRSGGSWSSLISGYIKCEELQHALMLYQRMQPYSLHPHAYTYIALLKACAKLKDVERGGEIHADIAATGLLGRDPFIGSALVDMYAKCDALGKAQEVFDQISNRGVVLWTALIGGYIKHGCVEEALNCFEQMQGEGLSLDAAVYICGLKACGGIRIPHKGQQIHAEIVQKGFDKDDIVSSSLMDMYASCALLADAQDIFDKLSVRDVVSWTTLIAGYTDYDHGKKALECFENMQFEGVSPNIVTFVCVLKACGSIRAVYKGIELHSEISKRGLLGSNISVGNALIDMYAKCGLILKAQEVFDQLITCDTISWNTLMTAYAKLEQFEEVLNCYERMRAERKVLNSVSFVCSLKACGSIGLLDKGQEIHAEIDKQGLESDLLVGSTLVDMYASCGSLVKAQEVFDKLPSKDVVSWTALIAGYVKQGCCEEALTTFEHMQFKGVDPNALTFLYGLRACGCIGAIDKGEEIHAVIVKKGLLETDNAVGNPLIDMYSQCGFLLTARNIFDKFLVRDVSSWNVLMTGYVKHGHGEEALNLYDQMHLQGISLDVSAYVCSLKACGSIGATGKGLEIHAEIARKGLLRADVTVGNALVEMYMMCGLPSKAHDVFDMLPIQDVVSWNSLITSYVKQECFVRALNCFEQMQVKGTSPDSTTCVSVLKAFGSTGDIDKVHSLHAEIARKGLCERENVVANALVDAYMKCGLCAKALEVFNSLPVQDTVSWNTLIAGYVLMEHGEEALNQFERMQLGGFSPNAITVICCLKACSSIGATDRGCAIHALITKNRFLQTDVAVGNALVDMYSKSGLLAHAQDVFDTLPERDVVSWTVLLTGYAQLGDCRRVFALLGKMERGGYQPNLVTLTGVLHACCQAGKVDEGEHFFSDMGEIYNIHPTLEQCTCMLDLLGRAGQLHKAMGMINEMPFHPDLVVWNLMLGACRKWCNMELGRQAFELALQLDDKDDVAYICMRNIYVDSDLQDEANTIEAMRLRKSSVKEAEAYSMD